MTHGAALNQRSAVLSLLSTRALPAALLRPLTTTGTQAAQRTALRSPLASTAQPRSCLRRDPPPLPRPAPRPWRLPVRAQALVLVPQRRAVPARAARVAARVRARATGSRSQVAFARVGCLIL